MSKRIQANPATWATCPCDRKRSAIPRWSRTSMVRECRPPAREPMRSWLARRSTMATSTPANASSPANISPVGPPPATTTACSAIRHPHYRAFWFPPETLLHDPGLAASPPVRCMLRVAGSEFAPSLHGPHWAATLISLMHGGGFTLSGPRKAVDAQGDLSASAPRAPGTKYPNLQPGRAPCWKPEPRLGLPRPLHAPPCEPQSRSICHPAPRTHLCAGQL